MEKLFEAYKTLGVPPESSITEITKAYRKLAKKYHPDSNPEGTKQTQAMMVRINEAYRIIKESLEQGYYISGYMKEGSVYKDYEGPYSPWEDRFEREKKEKEKERIRREEALKREEDAVRRFWEKLALERKNELDDEKAYEGILRDTYLLLSLFYRENFQNTLFRNRPFTESNFSNYVERYDLLREKCSTMIDTSKSTRYRKKIISLSKFLKTFLEDARKPSPLSFEKRAQVLWNFEKAVNLFDKFLVYFFSSQDIDREEGIRLFHRSLNAFEYFSKTYPESPLIEWAMNKVSVLEKLYRAFIKDRF